MVSAASAPQREQRISGRRLLWVGTLAVMHVVALAITVWMLTTLARE